MFLKDFNQTVYFCTNLIELDSVQQNIQSFVNFRLETRTLCNLNNLECRNCDNLNDCKLSLFDIKIFIQSLKKSNTPKTSNLNLATTQRAHMPLIQTQNCLFFTQTDSDYYVENRIQQITPSATSQYMKINSILDALESIGYYGFVNFRAVVQRIGLLRWTQSNFYQTQKTQTQFTQSFHNFKYFDLEKNNYNSCIVFEIDAGSLKNSEKFN